MVFPVFYEAAGTSARDQHHETDRVEANVVPVVMLLCTV
jgi:hypothetical protein